MSSLKLKTPSGGSVSFNATDTASDVTLTVPASNASVLTDAAAISSSLLPSGSVLQVVSTTKTDTFSTTTTMASGGAAITGLSVTITPSSTSSKFLLSCVLSCDGTSAVTQCYAWFARGSTKIGAGDAVGNRIGTGGRFYYENNLVSGTIPMQYLDLPSTLSPITYNVYIATETAAGSVVVNRTITDTDNTTNGSRQSSTLTVMEIAG